MKFMKKEYLQRKTRERGQASWVLGLFLILFLAILLCMQLQVALYRESAMYMEDALALSNLASAVIDIEEYGITQKVLITDPEQAYERYCHALRENLGLDNHFMAQNPENDLWTGGNTELHNLQCHVRSGRDMAERSGWNGICMERKCWKCSCTERSAD